MDLPLDDEQARLLREILDSAFRDLRVEIADTDNSTYKAGLRERRDHVLQLLDALGGPLADG